MAQLLTLSRPEWTTWFEHLSEEIAGKRAEIEVASLELGDQILAQSLPIRGITYDPNNDLIDVALAGVSHLIRHPREVVVQHEGGAVSTIAVVDADGARQILRLKTPVALPPASAS